MSNSPDPQTWIFPPLGAAVLPADVSASFGPISQGDKIRLEWAPASSTPEIAFICANDGTTYGVSNGNTSPYTYTFTESINNGSSHICWFFFPGTSLGNTLTFQYNNDGTGSSIVWEQDSQLAQALSGGGGSGSGGGSGGSATTIISTVTVTKTSKELIGTGTATLAAAAATVTITETITQKPSTRITTIANPSTTYVSTSVELLAQGTSAASTSAPNVSAVQASGLSAGAAAGITAAAIIVFALLLLLGWVLYSRRNRNHARDNAMESAGLAAGAGPGVDTGPVVVPNTHKYQPPMQQQSQPLMEGYYHPTSAAPRRTIHEIGD